MNSFRAGTANPPPKTWSPWTRQVGAAGVVTAGRTNQGAARSPWYCSVVNPRQSCFVPVLTRNPPESETPRGYMRAGGIHSALALQPSRSIFMAERA